MGKKGNKLAVPSKAKKGKNSAAANGASIVPPGPTAAEVRLQIGVALNDYHDIRISPQFTTSYYTEVARQYKKFNAKPNFKPKALTPADKKLLKEAEAESESKIQDLPAQDWLERENDRVTEILARKHPLCGCLPRVCK